MKIKLKLLLLSMMFIGLGLSFCSAENVSDLITFVGSGEIYYEGHSSSATFVNLLSIGNNYGTYCIKLYNGQSTIGNLVAFGFANTPNGTPTNNYFLYFDQFSNYICLYGNKPFLNIGNRCMTTSQCTQNLSFYAEYEIFKLNTLLDESIITSCPSSSILVSYNNDQSFDTITCDGDNMITIDGLSTITSTNNFTPYFNINYRDQDNQLLTESYSKDILYLSGGLFKKTYTGNNDWVLSIQGNNNNSFSGYTPTFDVVFTGDVWDNTGNIFNNFAENSVKFTLSNIPSYIQYVIIIMLLLFIIGFIRKFKSR